MGLVSVKRIFNGYAWPKPKVIITYASKAFYYLFQDSCKIGFSVVVR